MAGGDAVPVQVRALQIDQESGQAVLLLEASDGRQLAIAIGIAEATSIAKELEGLDLPRPLSHDLLRNVIEELGGGVERVEITSLRENTYYATLVLQHAEERRSGLDCRPSDAIAVAVRFGAPILVHASVLAEAGSDPAAAEDGDSEAEPEDRAQAREVPLPTDKEAWKKLLREMDPKDFGRYKI
ncbi:MAG: bifunctional nuclease family protein [Myxococcota bacterium]|nr:bifunctional nuclease family protein [Myxococcota bacterium]